MTTLIAYRKGAGLSQSDLAAKAGTTQKSISRLENGGENASLELVKKVVRATDFAVTAQAIFDTFVGNDFYSEPTRGNADAPGD